MCDQCGKQFEEARQLNSHKKSNIFTHATNVICKLFLIHGIVNMYSMAIEKKEVICDFCNAAFQLPTKMKAHWNAVYSGVRPSV